eukprot:4705289-Amphidinium_carterae.1
MQNDVHEPQVCRTLVSFAVLLNKDNKPQAFDVQLVGPDEVDPMMDGCGGRSSMRRPDADTYDMAHGNALLPSHPPLSMDVTHACWKGKASGMLNRDVAVGDMGSWSASSGQMGKGKNGKPPKPDEQQILGQFVGTIKSFNVQKG